MKKNAGSRYKTGTDARGNSHPDPLVADVHPGRHGLWIQIGRVTSRISTALWGPVSLAEVALLASTEHSHSQELKIWTFCLECNAVARFHGLPPAAEFQLRQNVAWLSSRFTGS